MTIEEAYTALNAEGRLLGECEVADWPRAVDATYAHTEAHSGTPCQKTTDKTFISVDRSEGWGNDMKIVGRM